MEQVSRLLYKHIFYTYGRYVHSEDTALKSIMPTCRNHFDKTGQTYNISAVSNNTHTVKQAIKMWPTWRSYEAFHASEPFFEANFCSITDSRIRLCRDLYWNVVLHSAQLVLSLTVGYFLSWVRFIYQHFINTASELSPNRTNLGMSRSVKIQS